MSALLTPLLARLTSATGFTFTTNATGDIVVAADDAFKLAAFVEAGIADIAATTQLFLQWSQVGVPDDTVMGQPCERVEKDLADRREATEQEKLAEAGRKSWVTRRANAAKKTKGGRK